MTTLAPQHPNPLMQIGPRARPQQIPLFQQRRQLCRQLLQPQRTALDHHMGKPRMQAQLPGGLTMVGNGTLGIQQIQPLQ